MTAVILRPIYIDFVNIQMNRAVAKVLGGVLSTEFQPSLELGKWFRQTNITTESHWLYWNNNDFPERPTGSIWKKNVKHFEISPLLLYYLMKLPLGLQVPSNLKWTQLTVFSSTRTCSSTPSSRKTSRTSFMTSSITDLYSLGF